MNNPPMNASLRTNPTPFVITPPLDHLIARIMRYLRSGYAVHLRGAAGSGKTALAMHLANLLNRPTAIVFGDDEFTSRDLIGNQSGYTRKKVVDNFIHNVVKVEDELKLSWVDSRLTLACKEGFTLVYDEFNRSRPEVNNVLLSALEEKILALPPGDSKNEYLPVHPEFRVIFTSNPEEYCGVHSTQDALLDRMITIDMPEPDELTQLEILVSKTGISRVGALAIARIIKTFWINTGNEKASGLRSSLMLAQICQDHQIVVNPDSADFRDTCRDILVARSTLPSQDSTQLLWALLNQPELLELSEFEPLDWFESIQAELVLKPESELEPELELELEMTLEPERELETKLEPEPETEPAIAPNSIPEDIPKDIPEELPIYLAEGTKIDAIAIITDEDTSTDQVVESMNEVLVEQLESITLEDFAADLCIEDLQEDLAGNLQGDLERDLEEDLESDEFEFELSDSPAMNSTEPTILAAESIEPESIEPESIEPPTPASATAQDPAPRINAKEGNVFAALTALLESDEPEATHAPEATKSRTAKSTSPSTAKQRKPRSTKSAKASDTST